MPYTFDYSNAFTPGMGEAIFSAAQQQANISQMMKNNEIRMKERQMEMEEARLQMQRSKMLMQQRQSARRHELAKQKEQRMQRAQELDQKLARQQEERLRQKLEWKMDQAGIQRATQERQRVREEHTRLRKQGAVPAGSGMQPPQNSYTYEDSMGQKWHVPRLDPQQQLARDNAVRQERNKLRKWGAKPMDEAITVGEMENSVTYTDIKGKSWQVPKPSLEGMDKDMNETMIEALEGERQSLHKDLENISKSLTTFQERKRNLDEQIREKNRLLEQMDEGNPRYKQAKGNLQALKKTRHKINEEIKSLPSRKEVRKQIRNISDKINTLAGGSVITKGQDDTNTDTETDTDTSDVSTAASGDESEGGGLNASWTQPGPDKELYVDPRVSTEITDPRKIVEKVQADMNKKAEEEGKGSHHYGFSDAVDEALRHGLIYYAEPRNRKKDNR